MTAHLHQQLQKYIVPSDPGFLVAMTHPSFSHENDAINEDYQRLEFLGDALLGAAAGAWAYENYPRCAEGELTLRKAYMVCTKTLSSWARELKLEEHLMLGGGLQREDLSPKIYADCFEAIVGVIYQKYDFSVVCEFLRPFFEALPWPELWELKGAKGALQELCVDRFQQAPEYEYSIDGEAITAMVRVGNILSAKAKSTSKKKAAILAATEAFRQLREDIC